MGIRTVLLQLHKPGRAKQEILDRAIRDYNRALDFLLEKAESCLPEITENYRGSGTRFYTRALSKWITPNLSRELNQFGVQAFKDSLKLDFAAMMANRLRRELVESKSGAAVKADRSGDSGAIDYPVRDGADSKACAGADYPVDDLRPLYFCRYDTSRCFSLLYDDSKKRYFAKLYLMNSENARAAGDTQKGDKLVYIHKDRKALKKTKRPETFLILPLSFGKWQEEILEEAAAEPERFKTARLIKRRKEYYLAVSIETGGSERIQTQTFLGVSRGLENMLNYTVVDRQGTKLAAGPVPVTSTPDCPEVIPVNVLHEAANFVCETAVRYRAQVVLQNLVQKGDRLGWGENPQQSVGTLCTRSDYNRFAGLLDYKTEWKSLPKPVRVSSIDIFRTCPECGLSSGKNRFQKDLFICNGCGTAMRIDQLGSLNLAGKLIRYDNSRIKIIVTPAEGGILFWNRLLGLNFFCGSNENPQQQLKEEIERLIREISDANGKSPGKEYTTRMSLVRKLKSSENYMDRIEYI